MQISAAVTDARSTIGDRSMLRSAFVEAIELADGEAVEAYALLADAVANFLGDRVVGTDDGHALLVNGSVVYDGMDRRMFGSADEATEFYKSVGR